MDRTNALLRSVAECILEEEGEFFVIVNADLLGIPLEGTQRLILGGKATPYLKLKDDGMEAGLSINRFHYDIFIPWEAVNAVEGENKALYCRRLEIKDESKEENNQENVHLRLVKD